MSGVCLSKESAKMAIEMGGTMSFQGRDGEMQRKGNLDEAGHCYAQSNANFSAREDLPDIIRSLTKSSQ